jgi:hypothetical protein
MLDPGWLGVMIGALSLLIALVALWNQRRSKMINETISSLLGFLNAHRIFEEGAGFSGVARAEAMMNSVEQIRAELTKDIQAVESRRYENVEWLYAMQNACNEFLTELEESYNRIESSSLGREGFSQEDFFASVYSALMTFQRVFYENRSKLCNKHELCSSSFCQGLC